jgi:hypothetical protein
LEYIVVRNRQQIREECLTDVLVRLRTPPADGDVEAMRLLCIAAGRLAAMIETNVEQLAYAQVLWPRVRSWLGEDGYEALTTGSVEPLIELAPLAATDYNVALTLLHQRLAVAWLLEGLRVLWPEQGDFIERWMRGPAGLDRVDDAIAANYIKQGHIDNAAVEIDGFCGDIPDRRSYGETLRKAMEDQVEVAAAKRPNGPPAPMKPEQSLLIDEWLRQEHSGAGVTCRWDPDKHAPVLEREGNSLLVLCFDLGKQVVDIPAAFALGSRTGTFALEGITGFDEDGNVADTPLLAIDVRQLGTCTPALNYVRKLEIDRDSGWLDRWISLGQV